MQKINKSHTSPRFERKFKKLPEEVKKRAVRSILQFEENPDYSGLNTHKLRGSLEGLWAFSVNKDYRVMFRFISDSEVIYYDVGDHDIYK